MRGVPVLRVQVITTLLMAFAIAFGMKIVGAVMITALLIIPPAAARRLSRTPEMMIFWTALLALFAVAIGLGASLWWDTPSGPSIVVAAAALFLLTRLIPPQRFRLAVPDIS
ncbi:MAG: hypothetical protein KatS3mg115_1054 [Candidatus Poribacteria bacterium]|nr:MAG: hypothetical protein KatS3mg115_1054 [Candidatus Poribacteria bacterium]